MGSQVKRLKELGSTLVLLERCGETRGAIAVSDQLRPEAAEAVAEPHRFGMTTAMLTGR